MLCWMVPQAWFPPCSGASNCGEIVSTFTKDNSHELSLHVATQRSSLSAMRALHRFPDSRTGFSLDTIAGLGEASVVTDSWQRPGHGTAVPRVRFGDQPDFGSRTILFPPVSMLNTEYDLTSIVPILHASDAPCGSLVMLRSKENQPNTPQGLLNQPGSWNNHLPVQHTATLHSLRPVAASSSEWYGSGSISDAEKGYIYDEWIR